MTTDVKGCAGLLRLVLERQVGALRLPPGVRIVAAANPRSSAADGWELSASLANRFVHLQWPTTTRLWCVGSAGSGPAPRYRSSTRRG